MQVFFHSHYDKDSHCNVRHQDSNMPICKLEIRREDSKKVYSDSLLFHMIKQELNKIAGYNRFIKKLMWKDSHLVSDTQYYVRSKNKCSIKQTYIMIYDPNYQIRSLYHEYNNNDSVLLDVVI